MMPAIAVLGWLLFFAIWWKLKTRAHRIESPVLGFLNLKGSDCVEVMAEDRAQLRGTFSSVVEGSSAPPRCSVLLIYADIGSDGRMQGTTSTLREIIHQSGAVVVLVASENAGDACIAASRLPGPGKANLVMTLERNGSSFGRFFDHLFSEMKKGTPMPLAWHKYAPQIPGLEHANTPGTIFACEVGGISFK